MWSSPLLQKMKGGLALTEWAEQLKLLYSNRPPLFLKGGGKTRMLVKCGSFFKFYTTWILNGGCFWFCPKNLQLPQLSTVNYRLSTSNLPIAPWNPQITNPRAKRHIHNIISDFSAKTAFLRLKPHFWEEIARIRFVNRFFGKKIKKIKLFFKKKWNAICIICLTDS